MMDKHTRERQLPNIDYKKIYKIIVKHKGSYFVVLPVVFLLTAFYTLSLPNYYNCTVKLSPELSSTRSNSSLTSLASSLGIDIGSALSSTSDALRPALYPELMASVEFKVDLLEMKVKPKDSESELTYYDYLKDVQKRPWWSSVISVLFGQSSEDSDTLNPHRMTKRQSAITRSVGNKVSCSVNKRTSVITISVNDYDPEVCTTIADSAMMLLQRYITNYRTRKARVDLEYNKKMYDDAKGKYEKACRDYAEYVDANMNSFLEEVRQKRSAKETEIQLQRTIYQQVSTRLKQAEMKVQEDTPAFAVIQASTVPVKKAGPRRTLICLMALLLAFLAASVYVFRKESSINITFGSNI
jgi:capsular polysaccharide biosynthesis protein